MDRRLLILDDFLPDAHAYREMALAQEYRTVAAPCGEKFPNVSMREPREFAELIEAAVGRPIAPRYSFLRFGTEADPASCHVHADTIVEEFAALLYLTLPEHCAGGTAFWQHRKTGFSWLPNAQEVRRLGKSPARVEADLRADAENPEKWEQVAKVDMKFNRMAIYPTKRFHSRISGGFGTDLKSARLTWITFFSPA